jgi:hypothetical protein
MPLPWVRLDANIATHDKILHLLAQRDGSKAFVLYVCALGYSGGHGTDGHVPTYALPVVHGNEKLAQLLVNCELWAANGGSGYHIRNWEERQQMNATTDAVRAAQSAGARKANCIRWHGPECGCWERTR